MAVADEIAGLEGRAKANLKAQRLGEAAANLPPNQRRYNFAGFSWQIHEAGWEDLPGQDGSGPTRVLRLVVSCKQGNTTIIDQNSSRNPFYFINPPIFVPDGAGYKEDLIAAVKEMLLAQVQRA